MACSSRKFTYFHSVIYHSMYSYWNSSFNFIGSKIRAEGFLRTIYLYPMALSFIVTGTAWKWVLNPTLGIEKFAHDMGFETFKFDWLVTPEMSIYTIVIAGVWQSSGFIMAIFLAGLRSVDDEIIKAAKIDGAGIFSI